MYEISHARNEHSRRNYLSVAGTDVAPFRWSVDQATLRILAVDNEPSVTLSLRYVFDGPRYDITTVNDGDTALARLDSDPEPFDVIIVDQKMPHLTGAELVGEIRKRGISGKIIIVSAHLSSEVREAYERLDVHVMFSKPFDVEMLRSAVDRLAA
jgi:two-component system response regulator (stage 0 sporulation protein F)